MLTEHDLCTGCSACYNVCPQNAITMVENNEGFLYPTIDEKNCIHCGLCAKACPIGKSEQFKKNYIDTFAYKTNDSERMLSQSGGAFWAIAKYVMERNGVVYGAAMYDYKVIHIRCTTLEQCEKLRKSKYVQSNIGLIFLKVCEDLNNNKMVLFSGTPCQVAGLYGYISSKGLDTKNLLSCDLICHGVPSPKLFREYIEFMGDKYKGPIDKFVFRDKSYGWGSHYESFYVKGKKHKKRIYADLFYDNSSLRLSCGNCNFTCMDRVGDITIADCWGIDKIKSQYADKKGVSLVIVNSEKGQRIVEESMGNAYVHIDYDFTNQPNLSRPTMIYLDKREQFWNQYMDKGFQSLLKKYTTYGIRNRAGAKWKDIIFNAKKLVKKIVRYKQIN